MQQAAHCFPPDLISKFSLNLEAWERSLQRIREGERHINDLCRTDIEELQSIIRVKRQLANRLNSLRDVVKAQVEEFDRLREEQDKIVNNIEGMSGFLNDRTVLENAKRGLLALKNEVKMLSNKEAVGRFHRDSLHTKFNVL